MSDKIAADPQTAKVSQKGFLGSLVPARPRLPSSMVNFAMRASEVRTMLAECSVEMTGVKVFHTL